MMFHTHITGLLTGRHALGRKRAIPIGTSVHGMMEEETLTETDSRMYRLGLSGIPFDRWPS